jgi:hypothetical protein
MSFGDIREKQWLMDKASSQRATERKMKIQPHQ